MAKSKYCVRPLPESDYELWNDLIDKAKRGTLFHQTHWLESFDGPFTLLGCYDGADELVGGMPLAYQRMAGLTMARPPYLTPYLGPVIFVTKGKYHQALTVEKDVVLSLIHYITAVYDFVRILLSPNHIDTQPFRQSKFEIDVEYTYVVQLDDMDRVWKELNQDKRRKIRKGYKEQLSCVLSDDLDQFFPLLEHSLAAHNKPLPANRVGGIRGWYEALRAKDRARLFLIKDSRGRTCDGAILVWDRNRAYYLLSGMNRDISSDNAMTLLIWECLRFCSEELGVKEFDFDGSEVLSVERFFRGFGGRLTPRFTVMWGKSFIWPIRRIWHLTATIAQASTRAFAK